MKILIKLLCAIGIHKWSETIDTRECKRCGIKQKLVYPYPDNGKYPEWVTVANK